MGKTGKTFYVRTEELKQEVVSHGKLPPYSDKDYIHTPHFVPNGKWVLEGVSPALGYHQQFVGTHAGLKCVVLESLGSMSRVIWIGGKPFGMIRWDRVDDGYPTGGISFESAKQVYNGQLGQLAPIPKLNRVHEMGPTYSSKRDSKVSWARASDLVELAGLSFAEIIQRFWPFNPDYRSSARFPATLKLVLGVTAEQIEAQQHRVEEFTRDELLKELQGSPSFYEDCWISASFGRTILRLIALGYVPIGLTSV